MVLGVLLSACRGPVGPTPTEAGTPTDAAPPTATPGPSVTGLPTEPLTPTEPTTPSESPSLDPSPSAMPSGDPTIDPSSPATPSAALTATWAPTRTPTPTRAPTPTRIPTKPAATATPGPTPPPSGLNPVFVAPLYMNQYPQNQSLVPNQDGSCSLDTGKTGRGVVLVRVSGEKVPSTTRVKVIVRKTSGDSSGSSYQYDLLERDAWIGFPLQMGNGDYNVTVYRNIQDSNYVAIHAHDLSVSLSSTLPLYTSSVHKMAFGQSTDATELAGELCAGLTDPVARLNAIYAWIEANISYDRALADAIRQGTVVAYVPDPDRTLRTRKGICYDYAALFAAMLRSQGIPTRLLFGDVTPASGSTFYHAWNEVFFEGKGWVRLDGFNWLYVNGTGWPHFDTTLAAGGHSPEGIRTFSYVVTRTF